MWMQMDAAIIQLAHGSCLFFSMVSAGIFTWQPVEQLKLPSKRFHRVEEMPEFSHNSG